MEQQAHDVFISFSFKDQTVVETIVNQLLNKYRITYWICTRDLRAGTHYKRSIVDAISAAKLVLLIQSESSMASEEVPKEISLALKMNKTVIPFVLDQSELIGDLIYDLLTVQHIDASKPTLDDRIEELAKQIYLVLGKDMAEIQNACGVPLQKGERLVSTTSVLPKKIFMGRDALLETVHRNFCDGERVQFLHGIGGIGKTQIAKQYVKRYKQDYDTVLFATYNGSLRDMVISDTPFCIEPELVRYTQADGSAESDDDFFARKLKKLRALSDERTLIVIDNFDVESDAHLSELLEGNYRLLITTRCDFSRYYTTVEVSAIDSMDDLLDIFMQNYDGMDVSRDDPALTELIELVNRHTYTVELLAQHMENSGQTAEEMIRALQKEGVRSLNEEVRDADSKSQIAYKNLLRMFKIFSLSEEEQRILMYLSFMPLEGVGARNFRDWAELDSTKLIKTLENKGWIIKNTQGIALHPVIREVVLHEVPADEQNCASFLKRFLDAIEDKKTWHYKKSEKDRFAAITKTVLAQFSLITPQTEELYYHAESLMSFATDPVYAEKLALRLYNYHSKTYGQNAFKTARAAFKLGWLYAFNTQLPDALATACVWLQKSAEIFCRVDMVTSDELSRYTINLDYLAKTHLALYEQNDESTLYDRAKAYAEAALEHAVAHYTPQDYHYAKIAGARMRLADILYTGNALSEALEQIDGALEILLSMFSENDSDSTLAIYRKAAILAKMGRVPEAAVLAEKSAYGYAEFVGTAHPNVYHMFVLLGDCRVQLGETEKARDAYRLAQATAEAIFSPDSTPIETIRQKLKDLV